MAFFRSYDWPGNIRELEHIIEGGMNFAQNGERLSRSHLPEHLCRRMSGQPEPAPVPSAPLIPPPEPTWEPAPAPAPQAPVQSPPQRGQGLAQGRQAFERERIEQELTHTRGNVSRTAAILGISRQSLQYKMKKLNLRREDFLA